MTLSLGPLPSPPSPLSVMAKVADSHSYLDLKTVADIHVGHSCSQRVLSVPTSCVAACRHKLKAY